MTFNAPWEVKSIATPKGTARKVSGFPKRRFSFHLVTEGSVKLPMTKSASPAKPMSQPMKKLYPPKERSAAFGFFRRDSVTGIAPSTRPTIGVHHPYGGGISGVGVRVLSAKTFASFTRGTSSPFELRYFNVATCFSN